jgi:hypothetical protein
MAKNKATKAPTLPKATKQLLGLVDAVAQPAVDAVLVPEEQSGVAHASLVASPASPRPVESPDELSSEQEAEALTLAQNPPPEPTDADKMYALSPDGKRKSRTLAPFEIKKVLKLNREFKKTQWEIARALGVNQSSISRCLATYEDTRVTAELLRNAKAEEAMTRLFDADEAPASRKILLAVLQGTKTPAGQRLIEPKEKPSGDSNSGRRTNVYLGVKVNLRDQE